MIRVRGSYFFNDFQIEKGQPCPPQAANKADITLLKMSDFLMMITSNAYLLCMLWQLLSYTHFCDAHINWTRTGGVFSYGDSLVKEPNIDCR